MSVQEAPFLPSEEDALSVAQDARTTIALAIEHWFDLGDNRLQDIVEKYCSTSLISDGQLQWLKRALTPYTSAIPLYGDFKAIWVMFMIAGQDIQQPKVRLLTKENTFVQLTFKAPKEDQPREIYIHRDGWQGHGHRKFVGWISHGVLKPYLAKHLTQDIIDLLQDFSLDPAAVAKASAHRLGACSFCGTRLSDDESKARGYGPICADHWHLPWGDKGEAYHAEVQRVQTMDVKDLLA